MVQNIKKKDVGLKNTDMANMFNAYRTDEGDDFFYSGRTIEFGNINQLNEKYVSKHLWKDEDSWYKLAHAYYGNSKLWWVICKANEITNPLNTPENETIINIPKQNILKVVLDRITE